MSDRDPETIKQNIDLTREQLAVTVDSLAERANPRRLADNLKAWVIEFVKKPVVIASLVGVSLVIVVVQVRWIRGRRVKTKLLAAQGIPRLVWSTPAS
ncbi:hypothetical protein MUBE_14550 [Mycobacterium uberis]|uniref:DUF3618 domain-containing protein n=1 Tax=Mycobacterium uberis TaxID=2162698 RepID=A0A3E1HBV2_9MYCO|nr:hypothetical protein MUBE_14550 [Mycobacterium uberis]